MSISVTSNMSIADIYQRLAGLVDGYTGHNEGEVRRFIESVAAQLPNVGKNTVNTSGLNSRNCVVTESERTQIREIANLLRNTSGVNGWPVLRAIMWCKEDANNVLKLLNFFVENKFYSEVVDILLRGDGYSVGFSLSAKNEEGLNELISKLPQYDQDYLRNAYYIEYGDDGAALYQTYIISGDSFRAS